MTTALAIPQEPIVDPMIPVPRTIKKIVWETDDTYTILLDPPPADAPKFSFMPGQFNMLYVYGTGESAISISSDPSKPNQLAHTIHRVGTVTTAISQMKKGDVIGIRGPFGTKWPVHRAHGFDVCIVAGGIGLAPLRPVIYSLLSRRKDYGRILLLYGARNPLDLLYRVELEQWSKQYNVDILITVDRGDSSWKGYVGVVTNLFSYIKLDARATIAMVCGPEMMMQYTIAEIQRRGVPPEQIYLSMERNMKCAVGFCGHCQYGPKFICKDGPVFALPQISYLFEKKER
jgi:NAD(P)H-flavin reductase